MPTGRSVGFGFGSVYATLDELNAAGSVVLPGCPNQRCEGGADRKPVSPGLNGGGNTMEESTAVRTSILKSKETSSSHWMATGVRGTGCCVVSIMLAVTLSK